ncbi:MAG: oxidoreductase [Hyphomonas sp.]|uniref:SDR family NAD(P)-dependent oxidoreductase n=1 Tax=Hyphomonas sp. TaxID=87 RepID=UPI0025C5CEA7|nr:SDR family oxidoreductase [Hyphomonas sp.]MBA4338148.1 oxidoreductase [Hyphomonas sp.]
MLDHPTPARRVLVTGSSSGIGSAIAKRLHGEGWTVIGLDIVAAESAPWLHAQIIADLTQLQDLEQKVTPHSPFLALVHSAGFMRTAPLESLDTEDGRAMWSVHVQGLTVLAKLLVPAMPAGGRVLAIGSRTSRGAAGRSQYAAAKSAINALIRSWAIELAPRGITANVISPAATETPMLSDPSRAGVRPVLPPIGRYVDSAEIAAYASFILSPEAGAITGQELLICGGSSL